jgi:hypothetical protein
MGMIEFLSSTLSQTFQVGGATGPQVKNNGGKQEVVDAAGSTTQAIVATPPANDHAANKAYVDGLVGDQGKVLEKRATAPPLSRSQRSRPAACSFDFNDAVAAGTGTVTSTAQLPNGALIQSVDLKVLSNFDGGVSLKVGTPAADDAFMQSSHNDPVTPGTYSHDDRSAPLGAAAAVQVTPDATGTPFLGSGIAFVSSSLPLS